MNHKNICNIIRLEAEIMKVNRFIEQTAHQITADVLAGDRCRAKDNLEILYSAGVCRNLISGAVETINAQNKKKLYVCSSWFLKERLLELTATEDEAMSYASGIRIGEFISLDRALALEYLEQNEVFVKADSKSSGIAFQKLQESGQKLHAWLHSHPGRGKGATAPSHIDDQHQADLEKGGYEAIGAIFVRDGYARFFSHQLEFELLVLGKGIEQVDEKVYKIKL